ncbi:hypothetical protein FB566_0881 [Stackebrandtia endophytica]|uniref:Uncharacterized protein n=1 Tax=Stackebrandtia endophytica TaxID=1496996 RepID=A0A543AS19_9ACTN|nr:hypothetical protein [Stackebrandtia endophytica]TQL75380.1 hypothetical protein FB566_0881 [Stackebrandtia endophytica]
MKTSSYIDVIETVPHLVGHQPVDATTIIAVGEGRPVVGYCHSASEMADVPARLAVPDQVGELIIVGYTGPLAPVDTTMRRTARIADHLQQQAPVSLVLVVNGHRWTIPDPASGGTRITGWHTTPPASIRPAVPLSFGCRHEPDWLAIEDGRLASRS